MHFPEYDDFGEDELIFRVYMHLILAVTYRDAVIAPEWADELAQEVDRFVVLHQCKKQAVALLPDHLHLVFRSHQDVALNPFVQAMKDHLATWIQQNHATSTPFAWQEGYACWTVGVNKLPEERKYLEEQAGFHREVPFVEEYPMLLQAQGFEFNQDDLYEPLK